MLSLICPPWARFCQTHTLLNGICYTIFGVTRFLGIVLAWKIPIFHPPVLSLPQSVTIFISVEESAKLKFAPNYFGHAQAHHRSVLASYTSPSSILPSEASKPAQILSRVYSITYLPPCPSSALPIVSCMGTTCVDAGHETSSSSRRSRPMTMAPH